MECRRGLAMWILSVRLFVKRVISDKMEESSVQISEKSSINTNRTSTTRFPRSLRWSSYVAPTPPQWGSKTLNRRFRWKLALLKKVCYKVSLCENCQRQSCKTFIGLTYRAKINWWGCPLLRELGRTDRVGAKSPISIYFRFSPVAPQP